jgi:hypothetical protein
MSSQNANGAQSLLVDRARLESTHGRHGQLDPERHRRVGILDDRPSLREKLNRLSPPRAHNITVRLTTVAWFRALARTRSVCSAGLGSVGSKSSSDHLQRHLSALSTNLRNHSRLSWSHGGEVNDVIDAEACERTDHFRLEGRPVELAWKEREWYARYRFVRWRHS